MVHLNYPTTPHTNGRGFTSKGTLISSGNTRKCEIPRAPLRIPSGKKSKSPMQLEQAHLDPPDWKKNSPVAGGGYHFYFYQLNSA